MAQPKTAAQMVTEAKGRIENLTPERVAAEVGTGDVTLVDIREDEDRARDGAIPGSVRAPRGMLEFWADPTSPFHRKEFDPARRTILYCGGGGQSALAADTLQRMGTTSPTSTEGSLRGSRRGARWRRSAPVRAAALRSDGGTRATKACG